MAKAKNQLSLRSTPFSPSSLNAVCLSICAINQGWACRGLVCVGVGCLWPTVLELQIVLSSN